MTTTKLDNGNLIKAIIISCFCFIVENNENKEKKGKVEHD